jgi:flavin-dependent dehydrogenase
MNSHYDALIIGAGVAGATAAILLAQAGWSVAIVEKHRFPRRKVCGECIAASNLPLLDALGIGAAFERLAGAPLRRVGLFVGEDVLTAELPGYDHPVHRWGRALGREHLDTLLLQRAAECGASVWQPWTVRTLKRTGDRHECAVKALDSDREATLSASLLIDAHGSWEPLPSGVAARPAGTWRNPDTEEPPLRAPPRGSDLFAFKGNFNEADLDTDLVPVLAFAGGYGGMVQAADGELTIACCVRRDALKAIRAKAAGERAAHAVQRHLQASCRGVRLALRGARQHNAWLSVGPIRPGIREAADGAGRFAIGNAAGEAHPILGEGISMAIQSAWLLCTSLLGAQLRGEPQAVASACNNQRMADLYRSAWRRSFAGRIRTAAVFSNLAMRPTAASALLPVLRRWPRLLSVGARLGGKVSCTVNADAWRPQAISDSVAISTSAHRS